jgi:hypothetical protein
MNTLAFGVSAQAGASPSHGANQALQLPKPSHVENTPKGADVSLGLLPYLPGNWELR